MGVVEVKTIKCVNREKRGEFVSLFSDSASVQSGDRMIRMETSYKCLSFSKPHDLKAPPLSSLPSSLSAGRS